MFKDEIEMRVNTIPSAVVSASANTVGGVPVCREDEAATADVVVVKLKQPLSPAETDSIFFLLLFNLNWIEFESTCWKKIWTFTKTIRLLNSIWVKVLLAYRYRSSELIENHFAKKSMWQKCMAVILYRKSLKRFKCPSYNYNVAFIWINNDALSNG